MTTFTTSTLPAKTDHLEAGKYVSVGVYSPPTELPPLETVATGVWTQIGTLSGGSGEYGAWGILWGAGQPIYEFQPYGGGISAADKAALDAAASAAASAQQIAGQLKTQLDTLKANTASTQASDTALGSAIASLGGTVSKAFDTSGTGLNLPLIAIGAIAIWIFIKRKH